LSEGVFVLASLHDLHETLEGYTYWHLKGLIDAYQPGLLHGGEPSNWPLNTDPTAKHLSAVQA